ncbi:hypothetical protein Hanom_Chr10g00917181 [Helianthus anomalus]
MSGVTEPISSGREGHDKPDHVAPVRPESHNSRLQFSPMKIFAQTKLISGCFLFSVKQHKV